jgi:porin
MKYLSTEQQRARQLLIARKGGVFLLANLMTPVFAQQSADPVAARTALSGDWGGHRTTLQQRGISIKPRLTLFDQSLLSGDGDHGFEFGGKADVAFGADFGKLGWVDGLSLTVHAEYNFGESSNTAGGTLLPVNTALLFPGLSGANAFDLTSVFFAQRLNDATTLMFGKINMVDIAAGKPFMGGAGIDSFQNIAFVAPPSGMLPPYIFGGILSLRATAANCTFMLYDPKGAVNTSGLEKPFSDGVTTRASVDVPVTFAGLNGHQGFSAAYSTQDGKDFESLGDINLPPTSGGTGIKNSRFHFSYSFDQYLYQSTTNAKEGVGLFGQIGMSDGNPNPLDWGVIVGVGGTGLIPRRTQDTWGVGLFHYSVSSVLQRALPPGLTVADEQGMEIFYEAVVTQYFGVGTNVQIIEPSRGQRDTAIVGGLRARVKF